MSVETPTRPASTRFTQVVRSSGLRPALPVVLLGLMLLVATGWQGAFAVRYWAPVAAFALLLLGVVQLSGGGVALRRPSLRVAVGAIWALAAWSLLSALWATSPGDAWEAGARYLLYAALFTVPIVLSPGRRGLAVLGAGLLVGIVVIALITLVRLLTGDDGMFLAGRLDAPVGYRNATACLFSLAFWPLIAVTATPGRSIALRGPAFGGAALMLGLAFVTQSRGMVIGLVAGGIVAVLAGPDRVRRAWLAILAAGAVAAFSSTLLTAYHAFAGGKGAASADDVRTVGLGLVVVLAIGLVVGVLWAVCDRALPDRAELGVRWAARIGLAAVVVVGIAGALVAMGNPASYASSKWDEFRDLNRSTTGGSTRLTATSGQRYDLWRVAVKEWERHPIAGVGNGSYRFGYYELRATDRNLDNAHSLGFDLLAELGLVGVLLALAFAGGLVWRLAAGWRRAPLNVRRGVTALAAAGAVVIGQGMVDWMYLIPGITGLGLFALGLAAALLSTAGEPGGASRPLGWPARLATGIPLVVAAVAVGCLFLSDAYVNKARSVAEASPAQQLDAARTAAALDPLAVTPLYLQASALESVGRRDSARAKLKDALDLEPRNFVTLGLLGDLEVRAGRRAAARRYYARALALDPRDVGLRELARTGGRGAEVSPR
jgi:hypothetical protein